MEAFNVAEKSNQELKKKLQEEEKEGSMQWQPWKMLKSKLKTKCCCCVLLRTTWPPPGLRLLH